MLKVISAVFVFLVCVVSAAAQNYPQRPIRFVVPFAPGGNTDTLARTLGQKLSELMGQQLVIDNRGGGGGNIGHETVARAAPDGYTILLGYFGNLAVSPSLYGKLAFDPIKDFAAVTQLASSPNIFTAHPSVPARSFKEFLAYAKANPRKINFASAGVATAGHLAGELLNIAAGIEMQHVPYKGAGPATIDLLGGNVQVMFSAMSAVMPHIQTGKVRPLAVTSAQRWSVVPEVPTIAESGFPGFEAISWYGVLVPAGTPKPIVTRLNSEIVKALAVPEVRERLHNIGFELVGSTPEAFGAYIRSETKKWAAVVKAFGVKPE